MSVPFRICCVWVSILFAPLDLGAAERWITLTAGGFELYTNGPEKAGRLALERLDRMRQLFSAATGSKRIQPLPVRVFLFRNEEGFRPFRPGEATAAFFQSGPQRDYIVMHSGTGETYRVAYHEYVHLALSHSTVRLPRWLEEGTAEFYSTLDLEGERLTVGRAIPAHLYTLRHNDWLRGGQLLTVGRESPFYNEASKAGIFYAESWALVHMLNLAAPYRDSFRKFVTLLGQGMPQEAALEQSFGTGIDGLLTALERYLSAGRLGWIEQPTARLEAAPKPTAAPLTNAAAEVAAVDLLLQLGREDEAAKRLRQAAAKMPGDPEIETGIGILALKRRRYVEARQHLGWAIAGGSKDASTYFEYAMLLRDTRGPEEELLQNLRRAIELNPSFAEARFMLAVQLNSSGRAAEAIPHLEEATRILPRQAYFWQALSVAYLEAGRKQEARQSAQRALDAAETHHEAEMAQAAITAIEKREEPPAARAPDPTVVTPPSWKPQRGERKVQGLLEQIDCLGESARMHLLVEGRRIALLVRKPGEILMQNASSLTFTFRCGAQDRVPVTVEYDARPDAATKTLGEVKVIEFGRP